MIFLSPKTLKLEKEENQVWK